MYTCNNITKQDGCHRVECEHEWSADEQHTDHEGAHDPICVARDSCTDTWDDQFDDTKPIERWDRKHIEDKEQEIDLDKHLESDDTSLCPWRDHRITEPLSCPSISTFCDLCDKREE